MNPAELVLHLVGLSAMYMAPMLGWFMLRDAHDRSAHLWFAGSLAYALGATFLVSQGVIGPRGSIEGVLVCAWAALTLFKRALKHELCSEQSDWRWAGAAILVWALLCHVAWDLGGRLASSLLGLAGLGLFELHVLVLVRRLYQRINSRGLVVLGVGLGVMALTCFSRLVQLLMGGRLLHVMDFSVASNLFLLITFLCVMCYGMGYWGYLFEKVHQARWAAREEVARAAERQKVADEYSSQLEQLIQQRDRMVLVNSRFSALNALTVFNAGIVHEISQPLQGILTAVEILSLQLQAASRPEWLAQTQDIARMTFKISDVLDALRRLMQSTPPQTQKVPLRSLLNDCLPIIASECQQRGVHLKLDLPDGTQEGFVVVNRILMERVVLNLASNALESFERWSPEPLRLPSIQIGIHRSTTQGLDVVRVAVSDNGPGTQDMPATLFAEGAPTSTQGIGLQFVHALVAQWRGTVDVHSQTEGPQTGTTVTVTLPMLQD